MGRLDPVSPYCSTDSPLYRLVGWGKGGEKRPLVIAEDRFRSKATPCPSCGVRSLLLTSTLLPSGGAGQMSTRSSGGEQLSPNASSRLLLGGRDIDPASSPFRSQPRTQMRVPWLELCVVLEPHRSPFLPDHDVATVPWDIADRYDVILPTHRNTDKERLVFMR
jgi:hypothetical protein